MVDVIQQCDDVFGFAKVVAGLKDLTMESLLELKPESMTSVAETKLEEIKRFRAAITASLGRVLLEMEAIKANFFGKEYCQQSGAGFLT